MRVPVKALLGNIPLPLRKAMPPIGMMKTGMGMITLLAAVYQNARLAGEKEYQSKQN